jgi:TolB-like protein
MSDTGTIVIDQGSELPLYEGREPFVFVCYAHADAERVRPALGALVEDNYRLWFDRGLHIGQAWRDQIEERISSCAVVLFFVSSTSVDSVECMREVHCALDSDKQVITIFLDETRLSRGLRLALGYQQAVETSSTDQTSWLKRLMSAVGGIVHERCAEPEATESIAVLPFTDLSDQPEARLLGESLAEELMASLFNFRGLRVVSRSESFKLHRAGRSPREIGEALGIGRVLEGTVRRVGDRIRITASIVNTDDGIKLWSARYDRRDSDLFQICDDIVARIVTSLSLSERLGQPADLAAEIGTDNADAYYDYRTVLVAAGRADNIDNARAAVAGMQLIIEADPDFHRPYGDMMLLCRRAIGFGAPRAEMEPVIDSVRHEAAKRITQWSRMPSSWRTLYTIAADAWDWSRCEQLLHDTIRRGIDWPGSRHPLNAENAFSSYANLLSGVGEWHMSVELFRLDPRPVATTRVCLALVERGEAALGVSMAEQFIREHPGTPIPILYVYLARTYLQIGKPDKARDLMRRIEQARIGGYPLMLNALLAAKEERMDDARECIRKLEARDTSRFYIGNLYMWIGDLDAGFAAWDQAVDQHDQTATYARTVAIAPPPEVRGDPRFARMLDRVGLGEVWRAELLERARPLVEFARSLTP